MPRIIAGMHALHDDGTLPGIAHPSEIFPGDDRAFEQDTDVAARHGAFAGQLHVRKYFRPTIGEVIDDPAWTCDELPRVRKASPDITLQDGTDAVAAVALAHAGDRRVDRDDEHLETSGFRARDRGLRYVASTRDVELKPQRSVRSLPHFLQSGAGECREDIGASSLIRGARRMQLAFRIEHAAEADGRQQEWQIERLAEHRRPQVA